MPHEFAGLRCPFRAEGGHLPGSRSAAAAGSADDSDAGRNHCRGGYNTFNYMHFIYIYIDLYRFTYLYIQFITFYNILESVEGTPWDPGPMCNVTGHVWTA